MAIALSAVLVSLACAAGPAALFVANLRRYREPQGNADDVKLSVLIPSRDEERNIAACVASVLASPQAALEVLVLDDASTDATRAIVKAIADRDARVRLIESQTLPPGWNGKQRACWLLAQEATAPVMLFLDADVRLAPDALPRCVAQMHSSQIALLSGFPRQITEGWMEKLLLPLIHFVLLGFLPLERMRATTDPWLSAGCGQFLLVEREAYFAAGGHGAIRETRHDGLRLPELFRRHGYRTDIYDLTALASVRMYESTGAVWSGLAKNATEGIGAPLRIVPFTVVLALGQVLPAALMLLWVLLLLDQAMVGATFDQPVLMYSIGMAITLAFVASYLPRVLAERRFAQPRISAMLHPVGVALLLAVQWYALARQVIGRPVAWRARTYSSATGEEVG